MQIPIAHASRAVASRDGHIGQGDPRRSFCVPLICAFRRATRMRMCTATTPSRAHNKQTTTGAFTSAIPARPRRLLRLSSPYAYVPNPTGLTARSNQHIPLREHIMDDLQARRGRHLPSGLRVESGIAKGFAKVTNASNQAQGVVSLDGSRLRVRVRVRVTVLYFWMGQDLG